MIRAILAAGLLAGVLDITAAFTIYGLRGVGPVPILKSIASGLLGPAAFQGGPAIAVLGGVLHFVIATGAAAVFYFASRRLDVLQRQPVAAGLGYGVAVYLFMNLVVLPLSAVRKQPFDPSMAALMVVVHMLCVGLPIALAVRRYGG
jgi:hypothetical protein